MGDELRGIEGVDLLELDIISKERLPAVQSDFQSAASLVHPWAETQFWRSGPVGNYPLGPSGAWCELAGLLDSALTESISNLGDTADAIQAFLRDIMHADHQARQRLDAARAEMDGIPG